MKSSVRKISFSGHSDDLVEVEGDIPGCDEYNQEQASFHVAGLQVDVTYGDKGTWRIGVSQISEDVEVTAQDLRLDLEENGYSMKLTMTVPQSAYVSLVN